MKRKPIVPFSLQEEKDYKPFIQEAVQPKERKIRFDKLHPRKFAVTYEQNRVLTNLFLANKQKWKAKSITEFLTMLLRIGLRRPDLVNKDILYVTKTPFYKTVKPNTYEKEILSGIDGLSIKFALFNERATIHRCILNIVDYIQRGGIVRYEEIQPLKPPSGSFKREP